MESGEFFSLAHMGSKDFNRWNVNTANAMGFDAAPRNFLYN